MKKFEQPELNVLAFSIEDVITSSATTADPLEGTYGPNDTPILP